MEKRQGQIWNVDCNPNKGSEPGKIRPCLIVQTDALNYNNPESYICVPLTTHVQEDSLIRENVKKGLSGLTKDSTAIIDQLTAFDKSRFIKVLGKGGKLPKAKMGAILKKINLLFTSLD